MNLFYRRIFPLLGLLLTLGITLLASRHDTRSRIADAEEMMVSQGRAIADVVAQSSLHGLEAYNHWEKEVTHGLLNNARWVALADSTDGVSNAQLARYANYLGLFRIMLFDARGDLQMASHAPDQTNELDGPLPTGFLEALLSGRRESRRFGYHVLPNSEQGRFVAGVRRSGGGAVIVSVLPQNLEVPLDEMEPGNLIKSLSAGPGVRYVVVQDEDGAEAAFSGDVGFSLPQDDLEKGTLQDDADYVSREFASPLGPVYEMARLINLRDGGQVVLRVGLDGSLLQGLRQDIKKRALMRGLVFLGTMLLATSLLLGWQRLSVLNREVEKVGWELRMREEEARRSGKLVAMGHLAAGVAHQVRNPLNSIHMIAQMMGRTSDLQETVKVQARHIRDESARIEKIIQQFLDFSTPRQPIPQRLNLGELIRETVAVQASAHGMNNVEFRVEAADHEVLLDRSFLIEVLENLLRNAVEAMDGSGVIQVSAEAVKDEVVVVVADNGPGIPLENREKVFDLYFTTHAAGSGLGLSLTAQMVSALGGHLDLDDQPGLDGRGARFVIRLPKSDGQ